MSSSLRVNTIVPSTGTNVAIGTANGTVTFTDSVNFVLGTGSSIFSPASNTLTFGTNDAERLRIDSDGRLSAGGASAATNAWSGGDDLVIGNTTSGRRTGITLVSGNDADGGIYWSDGTSAEVYRGQIVYNHTSDRFSFYTAAAERIRITNTGRIGINQTSPEAMLQVDYDYANSEVGLRLRAASGSGTKTWQLSEINGEPGVFTIRNATNGVNALNIDAVGRIGTKDRIPSDYNDPDLLISGDNATLTIMGDGSTNNSSIAALKFRVAGASTGDYTKAGIFAKRISGYNDLDMIFAMDTAADANGVNLGNEKMRLTSAGRLGLGTNSPSSYDGEADNFVVAGSDHTGITIASTGSNQRTNLYFADGTSGNERYRGAITYDHNGDYMMMRTTGTERVRILGSGFVNIGNGYLTNSNSGLHVGRSSGGTAAGESVLAATLGNDSSMVSALLTVKNAGNRGAQGHGSGSPLAKFDFNNGTAFEIDKYGRRTLPYQPGCKISIDTNSTGGGNNTQTGKTILPFNNTGYGYNIGNHFNTSNHTFTAPLAGRYLVLVSVNVIGDNIVYIYKNGSENMGGEYRSNPTGPWEHIELCGVIECSANDTIQAYSYLLSSSGGRKFNGGSNPGSYWDTLSIYYLG
jgi:hypothetical protein